MQGGNQYLLIGPAVVIFGVLFLAPISYFVAISFWRMDDYELVAAFDLQNYRVTLSSYGPVIIHTLMVAFVASASTVVLGLTMAFLIRFRAAAWDQVLISVVLVTLFGGYLMKIYAWKTLLGNEGVINTALIATGVISSPITWLLYSTSAVITTLVHFSLPFAVLPIYASMRGISDIEIECARDLGANPFTILRTIIIPRAESGIIAAFSAVFLLSAGDYVTPLLVGGKQTLIGTLIAPQFGSQFNWPLGAAMSIVMLLLVVSILCLFYLALKVLNRQ